jgi:hypothetical protein
MPLRVTCWAEPHYIQFFRMVIMVCLRLASRPARLALNGANKQSSLDGPAHRIAGRSPLGMLAQLSLAFLVIHGLS